jgi:predicted MFS family arabinose efflux permease
MVGPRELPNAVALNSSLFNSARVIGPALGGVVVATAGAGFCFAFNAVSFLAVLGGLLAMRVEELTPLDRRRTPPTIVRGAGEALRYARSSPRVGLVLALVAVVSTFAFNFNVLLPVAAKETLHSGAGVFGALTACFGAGALVGALVSAALGRASVRTLLVGTIGFGLAQFLLAADSSAAVMSALLFFVGLFFTIWTANANASLQLEAPDHLRGRVVGLYYYAFNGAAPAGGLLAGWLAATGGTALAFAFAGAVTLLASGLALMRVVDRPQARLAHLLGLRS